MRAWLVCGIVALLATLSMGATNVQHSKLQLCSINPLTGYHRSGYCTVDASDHGTHTVCAQVTADFLAYTKSRGNDLSTPQPHFRFPGVSIASAYHQRITPHRPQAR